MTVPDLVVIGAGAAGIGAARAARSKGASVLLVERDRIGGDCTFTGCVPSKTLIEAAARGENFSTALARVHQAIDTIAATESEDALRLEGIDVRIAEARFGEPGTVEIGYQRVKAPRVIIATGARPVVPPIAGLDTVPFLTSETLFNLKQLPQSLGVLGGGPIGVEMAQAFARLGSAVTIFEAADRLLPREEPLAASVITDRFVAAGIKVRTGVPVDEVRRAGSGHELELHLSDGSTESCSSLLVALGRRPETESLELQRAGIRVDPEGVIEVNGRLQTSARGVYAVGDAAEHLQFTHVGYEMGRIAAANALARVPRKRFRKEALPWVTFTDPEVARVGLTEAEAARSGAQVAFLPMSEVDRAVTAGRTEGFVELITARRPVLGTIAGGRFVGATIVAPRAGEMIQEVVLAMRSSMFPARVALATHAYPTWSMAVQQATAQFFGPFGGRSARPASPNEGSERDSSLTPSGP